MSVPADQFGNLGGATNFANTNAMGLGSTTTDAFGMPTNQVGSAGTSLGPVSSVSSPSTPAPTAGTAFPTSTATSAAPMSGAGTAAPTTGGSTTGGSTTGTNWGSILGNLAGDVSSFLSSPLGSLAEFTALYKVIANQASNTQAQNNALAGQISAIGQPDVTAGKNMLDAYTSGNLTAPFQAQADAAKFANQKTATSQEQQVASMLANSGGQNMQSAQISQSGQIEAQKNQADTLAVSNAFLAELSASMALTSTGGAFVQAGIMQEIQSNTQLQAQLSDLMGSLAKAYAAQTANSGKSGSSTGSSISSLIGDAKSIWSGVTSLFGGGAAGAATGTAATGAVAAGTAAATGAVGLGTAAAGTAGTGAAITAGVDAATGAAGAGAAGAGAAGAGAAGAGAAGAGVAGTAAPTTGLSSGIGAAGAVALPLAVLAVSLESQPYTLQSAFYNRMRTSLTGGTSGNATYDANVLPAVQEYDARNTLYNMLVRGPTQNALGQKGAGLPPDLMQMAAQYGMLNPDGSVNKNWSQGKTPYVAPQNSSIGSNF